MIHICIAINRWGRGSGNHKVTHLISRCCCGPAILNPRMYSRKENGAIENMSPSTMTINCPRNRFIATSLHNQENI